MFVRLPAGLGLLLLALGPLPATLAADRVAAPGWLTKSQWYHVLVPRFSDGEPLNDPTGVLPWPSLAAKDSGKTPAPEAAKGEKRFGGDLQGLQNRLGYLKELGVDVLYLSPVFTAPSDLKYDSADLRHVDGALAVANQPGDVGKETADPATWQFTPSDRLFLGFIKRAHAQGLRVVLEITGTSASRESWMWRDVVAKGERSECSSWFDVADWGPPVRAQVDGGPSHDGTVPFKRNATSLAPGVEKYLLAVTRRWMDPDGDGNPVDGVDGWVVRDAYRLGPETLARWQKLVKKVNPAAVLVGDYRGMSGAFGTFGTNQPFDAVVQEETGAALRRFFCEEAKKGYTSTNLLVDLDVLLKSRRAEAGPVVIDSIGGTNVPRLWSVIEGGARPTDGKPAASVLSRFRLAMVMHQLCLPMPLTYYGDEIGLPGEADGRDPMWWQGSPADGSNAYRRDLAALALQLNSLRERFAPLASGSFRKVLADEKQRVLAFARALPGDEVIVVINFGDTPQRVKVPTGCPGQLIGVVTPELTPGPPHPFFKNRAAAEPASAIPQLRLGGNQQYADESGNLSVSLKPQTIRLLLLKGKGGS